MTFSLLHVIHVILMRPEAKMRRITANRVIAAMDNHVSALLYPRRRFDDVGVRWTAFPIHSKVGPSIFLIDLPFPWPTDISASILHVDVFEHVGGYVTSVGHELLHSVCWSGTNVSYLDGSPMLFFRRFTRTTDTRIL